MFGILLVAAHPVHADPPRPPSYRQAVQQAYDLIRNASPEDPIPAARAVGVLRSSAPDQGEIIAELSLRPAQYQDARARLRSLMAALDEPAKTGDPAAAKQRLHDVLSMSRYADLHRPPSLIDQVIQWAKDRINDFLRLLFGRGAPQAPGIVFYIVAVLLLIGLAVVIFLTTRGGFSRTAAVHQRPGGPRPAADYFAEADRLSAAGYRVGAIRALCAGVAAALAGERTWEGSPLTVREIFQRAPDYASLRQLLLPFEAAVYGGRDVDAATYERAAQVAAQFRPPLEAAA
jgi:hypothetical protein